jgi:anaerobic ribonucleoside-triphosphate reductase activating protein
MINYASIEILENAHLYGPGLRLVIWLQGCSIHCQNCCNQHLWSNTLNKQIAPTELAELIISNDQIEGITYLGGEPTDQLEDILLTSKLLKLHFKTIVLFTGKTKSSLTLKKEKELIKYTDILKSGPYITRLHNEYLQLRGSTNQKITITSDIYKDYKIIDDSNVAILKLNSDGQMILKGYPSDQLTDLITLLSKD